MKKVLLMNVLFKPNIGGVENSLSEIASVLKNNDYIVDIACSDRNNNSTERLGPLEKSCNYNIYRYVYSLNKLSFIQNIFNSASLLKTLKNKNGYSYIISRSYFLVIISSLVGIRGVKYIVPEVTLFSTKGANNKVSLKSQLSKYSKAILQTLSFMIAKEVFVFSDTMIHQVRKSTFSIVSPIKVEPGINLERFITPTIEEKQKLRSQFNIPCDKKVILCLGRFSEIKQFDIAIDSIAELPKDFMLLLVGSGPEREKYENLINVKDLQSQIKIFDSTIEPEKFYKLSDVFLMTSRYESFGQTVLEAYASGLKIIAFNEVAGVSTNIEAMLLNCKNVYFVNQQSSTSLAETICKSLIIEDDRTILTNHNNSSVLKQRYSWERFVRGIGL